MALIKLILNMTTPTRISKCSQYWFQYYHNWLLSIYSFPIDFIQEYLEQENSGSDLVICAHYLRKAVREIGHVSGKVSSEKILDVIFADFCIGK